MKRIISVLLAIILICSAGISALAAVSSVTADATRDAAKTVFENVSTTKFDVNGNNVINAEQLF